MKNKSFSIRLTEEESTTLQARAEEMRCTSSQLIRASLFDAKNMHKKALARRIIPDLCALRLLIEQMPPSELKTQFEEREKHLWQNM